MVSGARASLAPPCTNRVFSVVFKKVVVTLLGLFGSSQSFCAQGIVSPFPSRYAPVYNLSMSSPQNHDIRQRLIRNLLWVCLKTTHLTLLLDDQSCVELNFEFFSMRWFLHRCWCALICGCIGYLKMYIDPQVEMCTAGVITVTCSWATVALLLDWFLLYFRAL